MNPGLPALGLVACIAAAIWGVALVRDQGPLARFETGAESDLADPELRRGPITRLLDALGARLGPRLLDALGEHRRSTLAHRLDAAGRPGGMTVRRFAGRKGAMTVLLGGAGLLVLVNTGNPLIAVPYLILGWIIMDIWLSRAVRRRQTRIDRDLPDFLDVLAVSVSAGVGFRPALERVSDTVGGPVGEEIMTALREMQLGVGRREAFEALRDRNDSEFIAQFVTSLLQAEELGVPLADALLDLAREMRRAAHQRARRRAQRAAPRISLIVTTLIVPGAMILIIAALFVGSGVDIGATFG